MALQHLLFSCDPGKATGTSLWDITNVPEQEPKLLWTEEVAEHDFFPFIGKLFEDLVGDKTEMDFEIVCENFLITANTYKVTPGTWSLRYIGALQYLSWKHGIKFTLQTPLQREFASDEKMERMGIAPTDGVKGGHTRDALRHAIVYLVMKYKWRPEGMLDPDE
jgi:hypothetical protein